MNHFLFDINDDVITTLDGLQWRLDGVRIANPVILIFDTTSRQEPGIRRCLYNPKQQIEIIRYDYFEFNNNNELDLPSYDHGYI